MAAATNIQMNTNAGTQNGKGVNKKRSMFLAPQLNGKTITMLVFAYLAMVTVVLIMSSNPFESATSLDIGLGPKTVSASTHIVFQIPDVQIPAAPYIIGGPVEKVLMTNELILIIENPVGDVESSGSQRTW